MKVSGSGAGVRYESVSNRYRSEDLDPYQNVTDPQRFLSFNQNFYRF
jgi:hypothetical protein